MRATLFAVILSFFSSPVLAYDWSGGVGYPFARSQKSLTAYMNKVKWNDGSKVVFSNLYNCDETPGDYGCYGGFVSISNAQGYKVCQVKFVVYRRVTDSGMNKGADGPEFSYHSCRYK